MIERNPAIGRTMFEICRNSGTVVISLSEIPEGTIVHRELGGEHYVKVKFSLGTSVVLSLGDYVTTDFGRFELTKPYKPKYNASTGGYDYEVTFNAYYMKWGNKLCKYLPYTSSNECSFHLTSSASVHLGVIVSNINAIGEKDSSFLYNGTEYSFTFVNFSDDSHKYVQYNNVDILTALDNVASAFDAEWWVENSVICFGKCELTNEDAVSFTFGQNVADMKGSESSGEYATRIFAFGSTRNLPPNYRPNPSADVTKDGIVQKRLMLPIEDCPYGYVEDTGISESQAVEAVFIDEDIYPKTDCAVDEVSVQTSQETDEATGDTITTYYYKVTDSSGFVFNTDYILPGQILRILFQSGSLNGMDFECHYDDTANTYEIIPNDDYGRSLPDSTLKPKHGDSFVLYNWDATKIAETGIIDAAEDALYQAALDKLSSMKKDPNTYNCTMDSIWYKNRLDNHNGHYDLGKKVNIVNPSYFDNGRLSRIIGFEIKLDFEYDNPIYIVGETAAYSRSKAVQSQLDALTFRGVAYANNGGGGNSVYLITSDDPTKESDYNVYSAKRTKKQFLSRLDEDNAAEVIKFEKGLKIVNDLVNTLIKDGSNFTSVSGSDTALLSEAKSISTFLNKHGDTATGLITFLQGLVSNDVKSSNYSQGDIDGEGFRMWNENGASHLDVDRLSVRKKAVFTELEIKKLRYSGGNLIFSAAGGEIVRVVSMSGVWRCYFKADDGDTEVANMWSIGDLAMCKTFNLGEGGSAEQRYYWRKVTNVGTSSLSGEKYAWINLSKTDYDPTGTDEPQVGDALVQIGHVSDTERQNVIMLEVVGDNAPALKGYDGISNYNALVKANLVFQWSPKECWVRSNKFRLLSTSNGSVSESPIVNDRGAWVSGVNYAYYDRVSYNGNLWLCTNQNGTSGVPGTSADWLLQVSKGDDGKAFNIKDKVNSVSDLPVTGEDGDAYMVSDHLYVWSTIYTPYWNGYGQQDSPFSGFVSNSALSLTAGTKYKVVIDAVRVQSEFVDVVPTRFSLSNTLYLAVGAEMTSGGAQATESEAFLLYPDGNNVDAYYQKTGLGNYSSITIDVYTSTKGWRDMGTLRGVDGSDAYNIQLSTDNVIYDTDVNGDAILPDNPSSTPIATVALYKGSDVVSNPTVSVTNAVGCTASASGTNIYITAVSASQGQVTLSVSKGTEFSGSKVLRFACITYETMKSFAQEIVGDSMTNYATSARVATLEGDIYTPDSGLKDKVNEGVFGQSSTSVTSRLSTSEGAISDLQQTAEGIEASVKGGLVNLFSDGERERASVQGTVSVSVTDIIRSTIGYAYATYGADVKMSGESATAGSVSLSLYSGSSIYSKSFSIPRDGAWHRVSITVAIPTTTPLSERTFELVFTENGSVGYYVRHIMVQLGVYASQWSPSVADNETKFLQKPDSIGLVAYKQGGEVASIGAFSDGKVKLTGNEIILEGNVTAGGNVHINQDGTLYAKNGVFDGYLRSSVELSSDTSYAIRETLNFMATNDCNVYLPCDPDYIGSRVLIIGGFKGNGSAAIVRVYPGMAYGKRCYQIFPYGDYAGQDPMTWLSDDAYTKGVKMPWANISQNYDPWQCRVIIGVNDMPSDGSGIKFSNGAIELLGVPCYKGSSGEHYPIYKLKEDANGTIVGKKLNPNGTIDTLVDTTYSRDGEVENWTQWVLINKSVDNIVITE